MRSFPDALDGRRMRPPLQLTAAPSNSSPPLLLSPHVSPSPPSPPGSGRAAPLSAAACIEAMLTGAAEQG